jgi:hypothetical protein
MSFVCVSSSKVGTRREQLGIAAADNVATSTHHSTVGLIPREKVPKPKSLVTRTRHYLTAVRRHSQV